MTTDIGNAVDSNDEFTARLLLKSALGLSRLIRDELRGLSAGGVTLFAGNSVDWGTDLLPLKLEPVFELDARGDSTLEVEPRFGRLGESRAGEGELEVVDDDEEEDDVAIAVAVDDDDDEFDVDFVEFEGEAEEGEVDTERFGLPILFAVYAC